MLILIYNLIDTLYRNMLSFFLLSQLQMQEIYIHLAHPRIFCTSETILNEMIISDLAPTFHHVHGHVRLKRFGFLLVFGDEEDSEEAHCASVKGAEHHTLITHGNAPVLVQKNLLPKSKKIFSHIIQKFRGKKRIIKKENRFTSWH